MAICDNRHHNRAEASAHYEKATEVQLAYPKKWAAVTAILLSSVTVGIAIAVAAGQVTSSPIASAATITIPKPPAVVSPAPRTGSESAPTNSGGGWMSKAAPPLRDIQDSLQTVTNALNAHDLAGMSTACQGLSGASQRLGATLPSPISALTSEIQGAVDLLNTASNSCTAFGPATSGDDLSAFTSDINQAMGHLQRAQQIAQSNPPH
jgi:hypothetical protein